MTKKLFITLILSLLLLSCSTKKDEAKNKTVDHMKSETVTKEALSKSWGLLQKGQQLADNGKSIKEILKNLPDSTIVQTNNSAILFFIKGSIPMLIELPQKIDKRGITKGGSYAKNQTTQTIQKTNLFSSLVSTTFTEDELVDVVASEKGEDDRQKKKALIISSYLGEFGNNDDGLAAKKYLEKNKNYKGRVDFISSNLSLGSFTNFQEYDIVHLSTHGERFCDPEGLFIGSGGSNQIEIVTAGESNYCKVVIDSGVKHNFENMNDVFDFFDPENLLLYGTNVIITRDTFFLKSSFFDDFYGSSGLKNKIWVFSSCELGQRTDFEETMKRVHSNGHFFYWLNTVYAKDAFPAFDKFYKNLIKEGLDAKKAFEKIPIELRSNLPSEFNDSITTTTSLLHQQTGEPRHGIEVIELWHPEKKKIVKEGVFYPLVGDFGDGQDEALTLKVQLKGYKRSEFEDQQMTLSLKVDDEIVLNKKPFLPDNDDNDEITVKKIEDHEYGVEVTITDIAIPDVGDKSKITLKAYLHLNDQNFSIHKEIVTIKSDGIKATMRGSGKTIVFTFDDKRRTLKIQTSQAPSDIYMDEAGYMYSKPPNKGWVKIQPTGMFNIANQIVNGLPVENIFEEAIKKVTDEAKRSNFFFPVVEWGIRFRMSAFEKNPDFKKQEIDCDKPKPCYKFIGIVGQEAGSYAIFTPGGQLKEFSIKGNTIKYEYGKYDVILPNAKELSIFGQ